VHQRALGAQGAPRAAAPNCHGAEHRQFDFWIGGWEVTGNRITWTPSPEGSVQQLWETSSDGGKTWQVTFDGRYRRTK
jgi:hypothetical protein